MLAAAVAPDLLALLEVVVELAAVELVEE